MNIVYSASDAYAPLAGISLTSLLINNTDAEEIHIVILDNQIGEENREKLRRTANRFHRDVRFVPLATILDSVSFDLKRWNVSTFGRLFEASSLPDLDKVLHIDCDTVITGSLKALWETDVEQCVLGAAQECVSDAYKTNIGLQAEDVYVQGGILLINLKRIRELKLEETFAAYLNVYGDTLTFVDQEIINACVPPCEKKILPLRYNSYTVLHLLTYEQLRQFKRVQHMVSREAYEDAKSNACIYHFTWCALEGTRPWIEGDRHPKRDVFLYYQAQSEWADMAPWKDTRRPVKKLLTACVNCAPKWLMTTLAGYVHGVLRPWKMRMKRKRQMRGTGRK